MEGENRQTSRNEQLEKMARTAFGLKLASSILAMVMMIAIFAMTAKALAGQLISDSVAGPGSLSWTNSLLALGTGALAMITIASIAIGIMGLVSFIMHIVVIVRYADKEDKKDITFILLIVGFFVEIIAIIALYMVAKEESKKAFRPQQNNINQNNNNQSNVDDIFQ